MKSALLILIFILVEASNAQFDRSAVENDLKNFKHNEIIKNRWYWRPPFLNQNYYYHYGALANPFFSWLVPFSNSKIQNNPGIISTYDVQNSLKDATFKNSGTKIQFLRVWRVVGGMEWLAELILRLGEFIAKYSVPKIKTKTEKKQK